MSRPSWFSRAILPWYDAHRRDLPWRNTRDPYAIWLSEVILQQTRVDQGMAYWHRFLARFPDVASLAQAQEDEVLKLWQGLGYYSRARNLLAAARQVMTAHGGTFPVSHAALLDLPGVGPYTAAAIASIAHDAPHAVVDGNVFRVLSRVYGIATPIDSPAGRQVFAELANHVLDRVRPGDHNQAVMELGATVCLPKRPRCGVCPLAGRCLALAEDRIDGSPVKAGRVAVRQRHLALLHIGQDDQFHLEKRTGRDIWQGLYQLPLIETPRPLGKQGLLTALRQWHPGPWRIMHRSPPMAHALTHQQLRLVFWRLAPPKGFQPPAHWVKATLGDLEAYALPKPMERYFSALEQ